MLNIRFAKTILPLLLFVTGCGSGIPGSLPNSLLWKLEGPDIETSYLFGTIHIVPRSQFQLGEKVSDAFNACDQLVMELDVGHINIQTEVLKYAAMRDETTLSSLVSPEDYAMIEGVVRETLGLGLSSFDRFKPFVISTFLISRYIDDAPASFELTLARMAEEAMMNVAGLETIEQQMAVFDRISYEEQARELVQMVRDEEQMKSDYKKLLAKYQSEDLDGMYQIMLEHMTSEEQIDELLRKRNKSWVPQIGTLAADRQTLFAVGAAHLAGDNGLIALLREAGYILTPL